MVDFTNLLDLARNRMEDGNSGLACSILEACFSPRATLSPQETRIAFDILRVLIEQVEMDIRRRIADSLAPRHDVPEDLVAFLAHDVMPVAYPILRDGASVPDEVLLSVIATKGDSHRLVIAEFRELSARVSDALVVHGGVEVVETLLKNFKAQIKLPTLERAAEMSREHPNLQAPVLGRKEMTPDLAAAMYAWVGDALRRHIVQHFAIDPARAAGLVADAARPANKGDNAKPGNNTRSGAAKPRRGPRQMRWDD